MILRHIGILPTNVKVKNVYRIDSETTMIGRGQKVDVFLDSNIRKGLISRAHAQIIKTSINEENIYTLFDTSLNGTYVNDIKVQGSIRIKDGDTIAFGHLRGALIQPGAYAPQSESEFIFKFENGMKSINEKTEIMIESASSVLMSPISLNCKSSSESNGSDGGGMVSINTPIEQNLRKRRRKSSENELNDLINSVSAKTVAKENQDSQDDISFNLDADNLIPKNGVQLNGNLPSHPRELMFPKTNKRSGAIIESAKNDIISDTSINVKHVSESELSGVESVKRKMKRILDDHDADKKIDVSENEAVDALKIDVSENEAIDMEGDNAESTYENFSSENSEEVTDDDSDDSDFSLANSKPSSKVHSKRRKKAPNKFSPSHNKNGYSKESQKNSELNPCELVKEKGKTTRRKMVNVNKTCIDEEDSNEENYEHDKCAALDCRRPPNSLKQVTWVQCEDCEGWYHLACCGISPKIARNKDTVFRCGC